MQRNTAPTEKGTPKSIRALCGNGSPQSPKSERSAESTAEIGPSAQILTAIVLVLVLVLVTSGPLLLFSAYILSDTPVHTR